MLKDDLVDFGKWLAVKHHDLDNLTAMRSKLSKDLKSSEKFYEDLLESRTLMNSIGILAQDSVKEVIEDLVTKALQTVFTDEYSFVVSNEINRNKPETLLKVRKNGYEFMLKDDLEGGGLLDVVSFALRVILWAFEEKKSRNTIVLDEPGKFISDDKIDLFGLMIKEISSSLGLQFCIVTHEGALIDSADIGYTVIQENGISKIEAK